jgi:hypothetical protein
MYATASLSLRRFLAFERVVVLLIILARIVQLFRVAAHTAERAAFLFFSFFVYSGLAYERGRVRNDAEKQNEHWNHQFILLYPLPAPYKAILVPETICQSFQG